MTLDELRNLIEKYAKGIQQHGKWNYYKARPTYLKFTPNEVEIFNEVYLAVKNKVPNKTILTPSGGISTSMSNYFNNIYSWYITKTASCIKLTVILGKIYVLTVGRYNNDSKNREMRPIDAWWKFREYLKEDGIDLDDYKIFEEEGKELNKIIEKPMIWMKYHMNENDEPLTNVHHIDIHSSYPSGLIQKHPEFAKTITRIYESRKSDELNKAVLNYSIGAMHSSKRPWKYQWAHLAKDAIQINNNKIRYLSMCLQAEGREIIGYNTDGIWYKGKIYHDPNLFNKMEGKNIGQWENDHTNCTFRSRTNGAYEFIEDGVYHPVVRGTSSMDILQPDRTLWKWGDIYSLQYTFKWDEERGIIYEEIL